MKAGSLASIHPNHRASVWVLVVLGHILIDAAFAFAQAPDKAPPQVLPPTEVTAPPLALEPPVPPLEPLPPSTDPLTTSGRTLPVDNTLSSPASASQGQINQADIAQMPLLRPAEVLELIPGLVVTQHSGGGKANQWFLRGFSLDHGTDFATFIDNVPTNLATHAHGQGYNDINWLIPELVRYIDFGKGPYYAQVGDFSTVGYASIYYVDQMEHGIIKSEIGKNLYLRELVANSGDLLGGTLLYAVESKYSNTGFDMKEHFRSINGVFKWTLGDDSDRLTLSAYLFHDEWHANNQIPQRAVWEGLIDNRGVIDPTDHGLSSRYTFNAAYVHRDEDLGFTTRANVFAVYYRLNLFSDFTFFLDDPINGDQINQQDRRWREGANLSQEWESVLMGDRSVNTVGVQVLNDTIGNVAINHTASRNFVNQVTSANVNELSTGIYYINQTKWLPKVRTMLGLRGEIYDFDVQDHIYPVNSGRKEAKMFLPKGSLVLGPFNKADFYLNAGYSFHSNDARGVLAQVSPTSLADPTPIPAESVPGLVQARGAEIGIRTQAIPNLTATAALWYLRLQSELVFAGDVGTTEPNPLSERYGIEFSNTYKVTSLLTLDLDYAASQAHFLEDAGTAPNIGRHVPQALGTVLNAGPSIKLPNGFYANLRLRYFGPRYLIEDGSQSSRGTQVFELGMGVDRPHFAAGMALLNLFNSNGHEIDYFYTSRLPGDPPDGVADIHFKALEPFSARFYLTYKF